MTSVVIKGYRDSLNDNYFESGEIIAGLEEVIVVSEDPYEDLYDSGADKILEFRHVMNRLLHEFRGNKAVADVAVKYREAIDEYEQNERQEREAEERAEREQETERIEQEAQRHRAKIERELKEKEIRVKAVKTLQPLVDASPCTGYVEYVEATESAEILHEDHIPCPLHEVG